MRTAGIDRALILLRLRETGTVCTVAGRPRVDTFGFAEAAATHIAQQQCRLQQSASLRCSTLLSTLCARVSRVYSSSRKTRPRSITTLSTASFSRVKQVPVTREFDVHIDCSSSLKHTVVVVSALKRRIAYRRVALHTHGQLEVRKQHPYAITTYSYVQYSNTVIR